MRILLIKLRHLGDTLVLTPTLRFLKEQFPDAEIDVMVRASCEALLENNPDVHRVFGIARPEPEYRTFSSAVRENLTLLSGIRDTSYDFAFDLSDSDRAKLWVMISRAKVRGFRRAGVAHSWKHMAFNCFDEEPLSSEHQVVKDFETVTRIMGLKGEPGPMQFHPHVNAADLIRRFPWLEAQKRFAVIHATSRWSFKEWIPERWAKVADAVSVMGYTVVLSGGPDAREQETVRQIQELSMVPTIPIAGAVSLHEFGYILGRAGLFLGVDTFAMHLAAAMQTPTVALFGPSQCSAWTPWQNRAEIPTTHCVCQGHQYRTCADPVAKCLAPLSVEQVLKSVDRLFHKTFAVESAGSAFSQ